MQAAVFTIGHSTHPATQFTALLLQHQITALCDVRSNPVSRFNPQFNKKQLEKSLQEANIEYIFLGNELGARSKDPACYANDKLQYDRLARTASFQSGIDRVREELTRGHRLALMCAEKDPLVCHRTILVSRHLVALGIEVQHIHADGTLESHDEALNRLSRQLNLPDHDLLRTREDVLNDAYRLQEARIAYDRSVTSPRAKP